MRKDILDEYVHLVGPYYVRKAREFLDIPTVVRLDLGAVWHVMTVEEREFVISLFPLRLPPVD
jgi:hypothetical protein